MRGRNVDEGFSLIEVIIAMFILGLIAIALLPGLISGIQHSSQQSTVATATRQLNALVEEARRAQSCAAVASAPAVQIFPDGAGRDFSTSGTSGLCKPCPGVAGVAVPLTLTATQGGRTLAKTSALIYVPGAKAAATC